jgi:hypothetical protein
MKPIQAIIIILICGTIGACRKKEATAVKSDTPAPSIVVDAQDQPVVLADDSQDENMRLLRRKNAITDLIVAYQTISRYEDDAEQYLAILNESTSTSGTAVTQDYLSETRNDIRDEKAKIPELEKAAEELSKLEDPSYRLEVARFNADIATAKVAAARAKRAQAANAKELADLVDMLHKASADDVLSGNYPKVPVLP